MSGLQMKYFVLKPRSKFRGDEYAIASRAAMRAYADRIKNVNPEFYVEILNWVQEEVDASIKLSCQEDMADERGS